MKFYFHTEFSTEIYTMGYVSLIFPSEIWYFDEIQF